MGAGLLLCAIGLAVTLPQGAARESGPRAAGTLDLRQYAGTYYEIARAPDTLPKPCAAETTATYAVRRDGRLDVFNRCRNQDGTMTEAHGVARRARGDTSGARLEVRFARARWSLWPRGWTEYWVLGVGPDYSYAVIGDPQRKLLSILSRAPRMPELAYRQALEIATSNGYDVSRLVRTPQGPAWPSVSPNRD